MATQNASMKHRKTSSKKNSAARNTASKKTTKKHKQKSPSLSFGDEINDFVLHIESLSTALRRTIEAMCESRDSSGKAMASFMKQKAVHEAEKDGSKVIMIKPSDRNELVKKAKAFGSAVLAVNNIPPIFLCSLVHKYDAYLGRLLRVAFSAKPELLAASQKSLTYTDLSEFSSLSAARESLIEKEVESVIRDSHSGHFKWMEERFRLPLRKDLNVWSRFVEITERRNLFVHCDGIVSSQYLRVCKQNGVDLDEGLKAGDTLTVDPAYFDKAFDCILEIGIKLGHVLWRKLQPQEMQAADEALHLTGYDLLTEERYDLAKMVLRFATETPKKISSDQIRRMHLINLCIAHKLSGDESSCRTILNSEDWTACGPEFRMAVAVLTDNFAQASDIMETIGNSGAVTREAYSTWPLFKVFRESKEFLSTYRKLFGEEFVLPEDARTGLTASVSDSVRVADAARSALTTRRINVRSATQ